MAEKDDLLKKIYNLNQKILAQVRQVIIGQDRVVQLCIVALLSRGHILVEGVPGTGKTLLMRTLSHVLGLHFNRVQFTPDLMPSDILGTNIFNFQKNEFILTKGPIFTEFLLADEINRTPPKTQSALLQAMQEHNITIDGKNYKLPGVFMVAATQNPIEQEGTYPLPEAQLDRFLLKLLVKYPSEKAELEMVQRHQQNAMVTLDAIKLEPVMDAAGLVEIQEFIESIKVHENIVSYVVELVRRTRESPLLLCGASPRASLMLTNTARTLAVLNNRDYVIPDDVKKLCIAVLAHRIILTPNAQIEGLNSQKILLDIVAQTPVPK